MISVSYVLVTFTDVSIKAFDLPKLRGFFSRQYPEEHLFHNHLPGGSQSYKFPQIQYRVHNGHPALLGIGEGIELMKKVFLEIEQIHIGSSTFECHETDVNLFNAPFGQCSDYISYRFSSPWMALNQENYRDFVKLNTMQQKQRLKQILRGNLLTLSKGFGYTIPDFDKVEMDGWFRPVERNFHNIPMQCFTGEFTTNFVIPDHLGLGKQCARGFGVVKRQKEER